MCVCGSSGFIYNPWALVFTLLSISNFMAIRWLWRGGRYERFALIVSIFTVAFMTWSTGGYVLMIARGKDYFDLLLFGPLVLAIGSVAALSCAALRKKSSFDASEATDAEPGALS
jgi:hypothetical protein